MNPIYALTIASMKMFLRSRQALFFSLFTPLIIMFIFGSIGFDKPQKIDVGLVTHHPTLHTTQFIDQFQQISSFSITEGTLKQELNQQIVNSRNLRYIEFLLPGLIALSVMQMSVFSVAFVFTQYKEKGVLKRLLATPMLPHQFVLANVITRLFVAVAQAIIFIAIGLWLFNVHVVGSFALILLCVTLGAVMFLGLGFTVSGLAKTVDSVPVIANLVVFPMLFLGNVFFSNSNMPPWLATVSKLLPLSYFATVLRDVMTKGSTLLDIKWNLLAMALWGAALITVATMTFRFQDKEAV
jgi:ABC-2 type transport system permease protein